MSLNHPPPLVVDVARRCQHAGGRALLVGGCVRDHLLNLPVKDWDVEVHGLEAATLEEALRAAGRVNEVGKAFQVYKVRKGALEIDVSLPRRDSKAGRGHRGIRAEADPVMGVVEAARRRDLTINAMMFDPLTAELLDPWGGQADLAARCLRPVDRETFLEDPLRAVRAVQFAARFGFDAADELIELCEASALEELPAERILVEWSKLLLRGLEPARGLRLARRAGMLTRLFPGLVDDPALDAALNAAAAVRPTLGPDGRQLALMMTVWLARTPTDGALDTFNRLNLHRSGGYDVRTASLAALACPDDTPSSSDADLDRLALRAEPALVLLSRHARGLVEALAQLERADALGVATSPPVAVLQGRDLIQAGVHPGPALGDLLQRVFLEHQIGARIQDRDVLLARALALHRGAPA